MSRHVAAVLIPALIVFGCGSAAPNEPPAASPVVAPATSTLSVTASDYAFSAQDSIGAGPTLISLENRGEEIHHAQLWRLKDETTFEAYQAILKKQSHDATVAPIASFAGGVASLAPGQAAQAIVDLKPGTYALVCRITRPSLHLYMGMVRKLVVTGQGSSSTDWVPKADGTVTFENGHFSFPEALTAGHHVWTFHNAGPGPRAFEIKSKAGDYDGGAELIDEGSSQTVVLDLAPGDYRATSTWVAPDPTWTDFTVR